MSYTAGMTACSLALLWSLLGATLIPVDGRVHPDDFLDISCPQPDACLILDRAGNLFFTGDAGRTLRLRARLSDLGPTRIRFGGLLTGWMLDRAGRVWETRDGGRAFAPILQPGALPPGEVASCLALDPGRRLWVGTRAGRVFQQTAEGRIQLAGEGPAEPVVSLAIDARGAAAVYDSGTLIVMEPAAKGAVTTRRPLKLRARGVSIGSAGELAVAGCRGQLRWSSDRGRSWQGPKRGPGGTDCLRPLAWPAAGPLVLAADGGGLFVADPSRGTIEAVAALGRERFNGAALVRSKVVLVGAGGRIVELSRRADGTWRASSVATASPAVIGLSRSGRRGVVRSMAGGAVSISQDGGETWRSVASPGPDTQRVVFTDARNGFALLAGQQIAGTSDAGATWETLASWPDLRLRDLDFVDAATGWAVGQAGAIVRTTDAGRSWALDRVPAYAGELTRVQFLDRRHGYAVGSEQAVFQTADGGTTWHRLRSGPGVLRDLAFLDLRLGFVAGDGGVVRYTPDGGKSWEARDVPTDSPLARIAFSDPDRGLAAAEDGRLWATLDGGRSWHPIGLATRAPIRALTCWNDTDLCLVGGDGGLLLRGDPYGELSQ